ncbi:unnamed protein product [Scytosiphon promiscuus]
MAQGPTSGITYSGHYIDGYFEYRHVTLPESIASRLPLGVQQSYGWKHYSIHRPEPNILLFRRALGTDPATGLVDPDRLRATQQAFMRQLSQNHH